MKKVLLSILFVFATTLSFAKAPKAPFISVISGNVNVLATKGKTAIDVFDYSKTYIEGKPAMEYLKAHANGEYLRDWPKDNIETEKYFFNKWNAEMSGKGVSLVRAEKADYQIIIHVDSLDLGNTAAAMWSLTTGGGCIINGTIDVVDSSNGEVVCKLKVDNLKGNSSKFFDVKTGDNRRRGLAYEKMAKQVIELAKKK